MNEYYVRVNKLPVKIIFIFLFLFEFIPTSLLSQSFPDYEERTVFFNYDSLKSLDYSSIITASDGSIDPELYYLGPGDYILILIKGVVEQNLNLVINQEGMLNIPKVGLIELKDQTLFKAKSIIKERVLQVFRNVEIQISLNAIKKIKVTLIGAVEKPSSLILPGNSRLIDLLIGSPLKKNANLRNIRIYNQKNNFNNYDLLSFLRLGDRVNNPYLKEGDIIKIDVVDKIVSILGSVKYPGIYEFVENESVLHLIELSGGFLDEAKKDTIELARFDNDNFSITSNYYSYEDILKTKLTLEKGDKILIRNIPEFRIERFVRIDGFVKYPGYYKVVSNKTSLSEVIKKEAGGFQERASLKDAYIIRTSGIDEYDAEFERLKLIPRADMNDDEYDYLKVKSRQRKGKMVVDFERLFEKNDLSEDLILKEGDEIYIPEKRNYISLVGQVLNPGNIVYKPELKVQDYINLAGGFGWRAIDGDVRVIKSNTGEWIDADDVEKLSPGDIIWVPERPPGPKFWEVFTSTLSILGQVATVIAATVAVIVAVK